MPRLALQHLSLLHAYVLVRPLVKLGLHEVSPVHLHSTLTSVQLLPGNSVMLSPDSILLQS